MPEQISVLDILLVPGLLGFFGAAWFLMYWNQGRIQERPDKRRWGGLVLLALALILGMKTAWQMNDAFYRAQFVGPGTKRLIYAHYVGVVGPLLGIVGAFVLDRMVRARQY